MRVLYFSLFVVLIDQISKILVKGLSIPSLGININGMNYYQSISIIGSFFQITFIENPGMAFGLQIGGKLFLSVFTIFATLLILYFIWKNRYESLYLRISLAFIFGGAIGNLIDRIFYGKIYGYAPLFYGNVVDFFHVDFPDFTLLGKTFHSWPIFNIADIAVSIGFIMILFGHKRLSKHEKTVTGDTSSADDDNQTEARFAGGHLNMNKIVETNDYSNQTVDPEFNSKDAVSENDFTDHKEKQ